MNHTSFAMWREGSEYVVALVEYRNNGRKRNTKWEQGRYATLAEALGVISDIQCIVCGGWHHGLPCPKTVVNNVASAPE